MHKDSFYRKIYESSEDRKNLGFDYAKEGLLKRFLSPSLYGNPRLIEFLNRLEPLFIELIESVKRIQFFYKIGRAHV